MPNNVPALQKLQEETKNDTENLPDSDILARDIAENLESALEQFKGIYEDLEENNFLLKGDGGNFVRRKFYNLGE